MESIQPLKWKEQKETVSMSAQYIHDTGQRIYGNGGNSRSGESGSGDTGRYNHTKQVTSGISFAAESQNVTVGNFKYYEFQGTQAKDFDKVNFNISDQTALKIEQKTFKQADGTEVVKYMPIALRQRKSYCNSNI